MSGTSVPAAVSEPLRSATHWHACRACAVVVVVPTFNERENIEPFLRGAARRALRTPTCWSSTTTAPTAPAQLAEQTRRRARPDQGAPPAGQAGPRQRVPPRLHGRARRGLRRHRLDGRRLLARPGGHPDDARAASRPAPTRSSGRATSPGGGTANWPLHRRLLSRWGNRYTGVRARPRRPRLHVGLPRLPRRGAARRSSTASTTAEGYAFLTELVRRLVRARAPGRRGADRVPRPRARDVEDVRRGSSSSRCCSSRGGASATLLRRRPAALGRPVAVPSRDDRHVARASALRRLPSCAAAGPLDRRALRCAAVRRRRRRAGDARTGTRCSTWR